MLVSQKVFVAGASGVIGQALMPLLVDAGYTVYGSTRHTDRTVLLERLGAVPVVVDVFDAKHLESELRRIEPVVVIHQLTDLPIDLDPSRMAQAVINNARIRSEGTRNLIQAALAAGSSRMIAQSIAWAYAPGMPPYHEDAPLDLGAQGSRKTSVDGVAALETAVLETSTLFGTVLRYGRLYGPGTGANKPAQGPAVHIEDAVLATLIALEKKTTGIFNITNDNTEVSNKKAKQALGWQPRKARVALSDGDV